jgi:hypothetical protein
MPMPGLRNTFSVVRNHAVIHYSFIISFANSDKFLPVQGCRQYNVTIKQYAGGPGVTIIYSIDTAGIQVKTNCDLANCKERIVYNGTFTREQSDRFYNSLKALNLDTLQKEYEPAGVVYDRLYTLIKINGHGLPDKSIAIENQSCLPLIRYIKP